MVKNIGRPDRVVRIAVGAALITATLTGAIGVWGWIGVVPLATALLGWCPAYAVLGFNTCSMNK